MSSMMMYRATCGVYWLFLGVWVGALVMLAIAAAVTFRTVREYRPVLERPPYNTEALAGKADVILAGGIVGNVLKALAKLQWACAAGVAGCVAAQCFIFADRLAGGAGGWVNLLRVGLVALPLAVLVVDQAVVSPRIWALRERMFDAGATEQAREEAKERFDEYHKLDENILKLAVVSLVAAVAVSAFVLHGEGNGGTVPGAIPGVQEQR